MAKTAALITIHGMGRADPDYACALHAALRSRLGPDAVKLHFGSIYYEDILQPNQGRVWEAARPMVRWDRVRKFALFFLADAGTLESRKSGARSAYVRVQLKIARELHRAYKEVEPGAPLVLLAHSLGCQVLSNYLWDAQRYRVKGQANVGIWTSPRSFAGEISEAGRLTAEALAYVGGGALRSLCTTGCNIPMFVAGHDERNIEPIEPVAQDFSWHNFYDRDDPLGWPLGVLSDSYRDLVRDHAVDVAASGWGRLLKSWNPLAHGEYWGDKRVLDHLSAQLGELVRDGARRP